MKKRDLLYSANLLCCINYIKKICNLLEYAYIYFYSLKISIYFEKERKTNQRIH